MRQLCYNSLMLIVATASFVVFGEDKIEHTVVVSPDKAKNKAFRMEAPSIKPKVTLTWDRGDAVRVFDGESEVKAAKAGKTGDIRKGKPLFIEWERIRL